ncbi:uncharacterized protein BDZ99DRAFT_459565 [Mytilinidion resinicola]|uniref:Uncharacterized protein n=1 Tax=Mytilinidion resinicola TaxID=574789 RepID=A0A6A6YZ84_9PEZI|nr:uncharacterized protein BDZ99DRAFT_459565 [Mytilinidion resinicola]KAF2813809.1 hypothetical protein BDZ99DRAFT_459565 [Mytilinidion resinicola]
MQQSFSPPDETLKPSLAVEPEHWMTRKKQIQPRRVVTSSRNNPKPISYRGGKKRKERELETNNRYHLAKLN